MLRDFINSFAPKISELGWGAGMTDWRSASGRNTPEEIAMVLEGALSDLGISERKLNLKDNPWLALSILDAICIAADQNIPLQIAFGRAASLRLERSHPKQREYLLGAISEASRLISIGSAIPSFNILWTRRHNFTLFVPSTVTDSIAGRKELLAVAYLRADERPPELMQRFNRAQLFGDSRWRDQYSHKDHARFRDIVFVAGNPPPAILQEAVERQEKGTAEEELIGHEHVVAASSDDARDQPTFSLSETVKRLPLPSRDRMMSMFDDRLI